MAKQAIKHYSQCPARAFGPEAPGVSIRVLISDTQDGAPVYNMRMIEIQSNGHTPLHRHPYEHENYVLEGCGESVIDEVIRPISAGDVILVPPDAVHQYRNTGREPLRFLCSIPVEKLQPTKMEK
jgi:quercetin dioxygenase-like cupin family protein